jgi:hypothetical protein
MWEMGSRRSAILGGALAALVWPAGAGAIPASGPHATVDMWSSTTQPNASAGLGWSGRYHAAAGPDGDPPALRHLTIELPAGTQIDTTVPPQCTASENELMLEGESACPSSARIGSGEVTVKQLGFATATFDIAVYNGKDEIMELVKSGDRVVAVVHTYIHGTTLEGPVPTCVGGGSPPDDCPFDEFVLLSNRFQIEPTSADHGTAPRNYGTTPPVCPQSGMWEARVTLYFGDGSVDQVTPEAPCDPRSAKRAKRRHCHRHRHRLASEGGHRGHRHCRRAALRASA